LPWGLDQFELDKSVGGEIKIIDIWHIEGKRFMIRFAPRLMDQAYVYLVGVVMSTSLNKLVRIRKKFLEFLEFGIVFFSIGILVLRFFYRIFFDFGFFFLEV